MGMVAAVIVGAVVVAARTEDGHHGSHVTIAATTTPATPPTGPVVRYEVDATVLQSAAHGPELCVQVYQSNPPLCDGTPIAGWDWTKVTGQESTNGTTWGGYHLVGTYNAKTFTLTEPATAPHPPPAPPLPSYKTPCPTPPGGWVVDDRSHFSLNDYVAFEAAAGGQPDSAGLWIDSSTPVNGHVNLAPEQVITVAFTGNLDEHRAQLRKIWGGPFCVVQRTHSTAELDAIIRSLEGPAGHQLDLQVTGGGTDVVNDNIQLQVMVATQAEQQAVDERYGAGIVHLTGLLTPLP